MSFLGIEDSKESRQQTKSSSSAKSIVIIAVLVVVLIVAALLVLVVKGVDGPNYSPGTNTPPPTFAPTPSTLPPVPPTAFPTNFPTESPIFCPTVTLGEEIRDEGDYVGIIFSDCPNEQSFNAFIAAAKYWSGVLAGNVVVPREVGEFNVASACGFLASFQVGPMTIDHLIVIAQTTDIDGPGGTLAASNFCLTDNDFKPILGGMIFDNDDAEFSSQPGILRDIVVHEVGHVLGLSARYYQAVEQGGGLTSSDPDADLIDRAVFGEDGSVNYGNRPDFVGLAAREEYGILLDSDEAPEGVPLEDGFTNNFTTPLFNFNVNSGRGSIDSHWDKDIFGVELMTYAISSGAPARPISMMTLAALEDIGYVVDRSLAEEFVLPKTNLRGSSHEEELVINLEHDILPTEIQFIDDFIERYNL